MLGVANQNTHILLLVNDPMGNYEVFRIKRSTQLKKFMVSYCDKKSAELDNMRFVELDDMRFVVLRSGRGVIDPTRPQMSLKWKMGM